MVASALDVLSSGRLSASRSFSVVVDTCLRALQHAQKDEKSHSTLASVRNKRLFPASSVSCFIRRPSGPRSGGVYSGHEEAGSGEVIVIRLLAETSCQPPRATAAQNITSNGGGGLHPSVRDGRFLRADFVWWTKSERCVVVPERFVSIDKEAKIASVGNAKSTFSRARFQGRSRRLPALLPRSHSR